MIEPELLAFVLESPSTVTVVLLVSESILVRQQCPTMVLSVMLQTGVHEQAMPYFPTIARVLLQRIYSTRTQALAARSLLQFRRRFRGQCASIKRHILFIGGQNSVWRRHMSNRLARSRSLGRRDSSVDLWWRHIFTRL